MPLNRELHDRLSVIAGCSLGMVWAAKTHIEKRIVSEWHKHVTVQSPEVRPSLPDSDAGLASGLDIQALLVSAQTEISVQGVQTHSDVVDEHSSVVLLVKRLIMDAHRQRASDIHIETNPGDQVSRVRFRKDGDLEEYLRLPADLRAALVSRIKVMSKLDISERRRPQDGKINFSDFSDLKLELRVAILPTHDNLEDVVMRLLASSKPIPLAQLGFSVRDETIVKRLSQRPYGLLLACGPTGSGKTTTLHSLLSEINTDSRKIWTAEDPIEITQEGLRQLQVNPKIGVTFASAMRAFLRADPDVIMIGEVRDDETARVSIEASLTGHLVLSTLHTNSAAESVVRLLDLGMDPMNFGDSLVGIVAQRLIRALCKHCKAPEPLSESAFEQLAQEYIDGTHLTLEEGRQRLRQAAPASGSGERVLYRPVGCDICSGKGYKGRMGIYELLENSPEIKRLIQTRAATRQIFEQATADGTRSLKQDALEKAFSGKIDLLQARSVCS
jgi:type II secretory ATPase GspE/PulE/Tfp pilus assembly ATPase PilB-like protein